MRIQHCVFQETSSWPLRVIHNPYIMEKYIFIYYSLNSSCSTFLFAIMNLLPYQNINIKPSTLTNTNQLNEVNESKQFIDCSVWMSPFETTENKVTWNMKDLQTFQKRNWLGSISKEGLLVKKTDCLIAILSDSGLLDPCHLHFHSVEICPLLPSLP